MAQINSSGAATVAIDKHERAFFVALGARIAEQRRAQGLSQTQLGEMIGVSQQAMNSFEKGRRRVPLSALPALTKALGVSTEALLGQRRAPAKRGPAPKLQQQLEQLSRLPRSKQRFVSEIIENVLEKAG